MGVELMACSANESAASEDRRITRSKQALREAFIELTEECGLDGFSASDLCARAGLNRGTLYNIFGDKDGLLRALEGDIMAEQGVGGRIIKSKRMILIVCRRSA